MACLPSKGHGKIQKLGNPLVRNHILSHSNYFNVINISGRKFELEINLTMGEVWKRRRKTNNWHNNLDKNVSYSEKNSKHFANSAYFFGPIKKGQNMSNPPPPLVWNWLTPPPPTPLCGWHNMWTALTMWRGGCACITLGHTTPTPTVSVVSEGKGRSCRQTFS